MDPRISRRSLLRGSAGALIGLPWLEAMSQAAPAPRRLVVVASVLGTFPEWFWPRPPGSPAWADTYQPQKKYVTGATALDTTDIQLEPIMKPLEPHRQDLLFVEGLEPTNCNGHGGYCNMLSATTPIRVGEDDEIGGGSSLDQVVAQKIGKDSRFASLQIGVGSGGSQKYGILSWYEARKPAPADGRPRSVWDRVFASVAGKGPGEQEAITRVVRQRKSLLDGALAQATGLRARLGTGDQQKLDGYLQSFRDLEARIATAPAAMGCARPETPSDPKGGSEVLPEVARLQVENLAMAFACDLTRVATLQLAFEGHQGVYPWLNVATGHHNLSHCDHDDPSAPKAYAEQGRISRWHAEVIASLVTRLKSIPEGAGTVFDNTTILWINTLTYGATHSNSRTPTLLIGKTGGPLRTGGRHLRIASNTRRTLADLYAPIAQSFGVEAPTFGEAKYNLGALDQIRG
jgi:hypothetical protein